MAKNTILIVIVVLVVIQAFTSTNALPVADPAASEGLTDLELSASTIILRPLFAYHVQQRRRRQKLQQQAQKGQTASPNQLS